MKVWLGRISACMLAAAFLLLLTSGGVPSGVQAATKPMTVNVNTAKAVAFREAMRTLWMEHIIWTRQVIVDVAADLPDLPDANARLMRNQDDIGNAIKPYYGKLAGDKLTAMLKQHIALAGEVLTAAKAKDMKKLADAKARWYKNGDEIAIYLSKANPKNWSQAQMKAAMKKHLDTTLEEASARLNGNWKADIAAFDKVEKHILVMADMLSLGIIRQFPAKFK